MACDFERFVSIELNQGKALRAGESGARPVAVGTGKGCSFSDDVLRKRCAAYRGAASYDQ